MPRSLFTTPLLRPRTHQNTNLILPIRHLPLSRHLTRRTTIRGRDIQGRVLGEEVPRPQEQGHGFGGHDGEVLWRGEVRDAEGVPEHDVGVVDAGAAVGDPLRDAARRLA